jgi:DNA-binding transcriptional regulator YhcF (GntR family)
VRLWFAPGSDVPLYCQLVTQVVLAILSGDLAPGDRLPSTRELARRFHLHPNTVSAGYRELQREGWTELRHGSGVYVRSNAEPISTPEQRLDHHIAGFFHAVRELNLPPEAIRLRVAHWLASPPPDHLLLIDPDAKLRRILLTEIRSATSYPIREASPADISPEILAGAIPLCRPSKTKLIRDLLPAGVELITLQITSAPTWLTPLLASTSNQLIAVVSHWPGFLTLARTMFAAAGVPSDALIFCDATQPRWQRGLDQAAAILCDAYTATLPQLPRKPKRIIFPLLSEATRDMLSHYSA